MGFGEDNVYVDFNPTLGGRKVSNRPLAQGKTFQSSLEKEIVSEEVMTKNKESTTRHATMLKRMNNNYNKIIR